MPDQRAGEAETREGYPWLDLDEVRFKIRTADLLADNAQEVSEHMAEQAEEFERRARRERFRADELRALLAEEEARRAQ